MHNFQNARHHLWIFYLTRLVEYIYFQCMHPSTNLVNIVYRYTYIGTHTQDVSTWHSLKLEVSLFYTVSCSEYNFTWNGAITMNMVDSKNGRHL